MHDNDTPDPLLRLDDLARECKDCRTTFVLTLGEQKFFQSKQLDFPRRCKACRDARRAEREAADLHARGY